MTEVVKIPVIEKKRPLISRIFTVSFLIACILLFSGIIFIDDPNNIIGKAFMIVMLLFLIFLLFIKNPYNKIGSLTLDQDGMVLFTGESEEFYPIENVEEITFQYLGYYGRFDVFAGSMDSGLGNILSFRYLDKPMSFELKLQYEQLMAMKDIFNKWEIACKKEIVVKNYLGIKSNI